MPIAFGGLILLFRRPERALPDAAIKGSGPAVTLILFKDTGTWGTIANVRKVVKSDDEWRKELTPEQYAITRRKATEFAFSNRYWNTHAQGIYRCICCGNAVFRSSEKFDSGTGWPSFSAPIARENISETLDNSFSEQRTEVLCTKCDAHLGHVFPDGPPPTGLRYCINSGAIQLVS